MFVTQISLLLSNYISPWISRFKAKMSNVWDIGCGTSDAEAHLQREGFQNRPKRADIINEQPQMVVLLALYQLTDAEPI